MTVYSVCFGAAEKHGCENHIQMNIVRDLCTVVYIWSVRFINKDMFL